VLPFGRAVRGEIAEPHFLHLRGQRSPLASQFDPSLPHVRVVLGIATRMHASARDTLVPIGQR
jgi:hypothetical protein